MAKILPRQFFATKLTLLGLTVIHLLTTLTYGILAQLFLSESRLKHAYTPDLVKNTRPKLIMASSFSVVADIAALIALFTWELIASILFCLLIMVATVGNHFGAMNNPAPLSKIHWILFTLGGIMFILSVYYMMMQCQVGVLKPKIARENQINREIATQPRIVESKGMSFMKQIVVALILLHIIWTIGYIVQHIMHLSEIERTQGTISSEEIDIKNLINNWVLFRACVAEALLLGAIVLLGDVVALFGILQHKIALVSTFVCILLLSAFYALEGFNMFHWINLASCLLLLVLTFLFMVQLINLESATAIQWRVRPLNSSQQNVDTTTTIGQNAQPESQMSEAISSESSAEES